MEACHLGLKPFACQLCAKAFPYKHSLSHHMSVHLKAKDFHLAGSDCLGGEQRVGKEALGMLLFQPVGGTYETGKCLDLVLPLISEERRAVAGDLPPFASNWP